MSKKTTKDPVLASMNKIHEQLAVMDSKLDQFMTKSLKELAAAMAVVKAAPRPAAPAQIITRSAERPGRQMFAVVCYECGRDTEIPFKPVPGRPVYCKPCFTKRKNAARASSSGLQTVSLSQSRNIAVPLSAQPKSTRRKKAASAKTKRKLSAKKKAAKKKTVKKKSAKKKPAVRRK